MESVLAVLLFFGGLVVGAVTTDKERDDVPSKRAQVESCSATAVSQVTQARYQVDPRPCHAATIYRDFTLPYRTQDDNSVRQGSDCEDDCPDD